MITLNDLIYAGGPGSGCRGPNCGRPEGPRKGPAAVLKKYGWQHVGKIGVGHKQAINTYIHPDFPGHKIVQRYNKFKHIDPARPRSEHFSNFPKGGQQAQFLEQYLNGLRIQNALKDAPAAKVKAPVNAPDETAPAVNAPAIYKKEWETSPGSSSDRERKLGTFRIVAVKPLPKNIQPGVNVTKVVMFENGDKAIFKPASGQNAGSSENEVAAWEVAKRVGMDDLVSPSVLRTINGQRGALIEWQEGEPAQDFYDSFGKLNPQDVARAAIFDYVINGTDRHEKNWLIEVRPDGNKLHLIDQGIAFKTYGGKVYRGFVPEMRNSSGEPTSRYKDITPPNTFADRYLKAEPAIRVALEGLKIRPAAIDLVSMRIKDLTEAKSWADI